MAIDLKRTLDPNSTTVRLQTLGGTGNVDALLVMPEVATLLTDGGGHFTGLLTSKSDSKERRAVPLGGSGSASVSSFDRMGRLVSRQSITGSNPVVSVSPGGFTVLTR